MAATRTTYWRLRLDGQPRGLFRWTERGGDFVEIAHLDDGGWVSEPDLLRWWLDPGDRDLVEVERAEAEGIAAAADVALDAPALTR